MSSPPLQSLAETPPGLFATHYGDGAEKLADLIVHLTGLALALVGGGMLLGLAIGFGDAGGLWAAAINAAGLLTMLALSTAYNFAAARFQPLLRRFDHAGIFLMIAGSYTPFTTQSLHGGWAWGMTAAVWGVAGFGVLSKLLMKQIDRKFSVALYLALGWLVVVALKPMIDSVAWYAMLLLVAGGVIYSTGVVFYVNKRLKFARAIWHGHVVAAAATHWAAVLLGVVLTTQH